MGARVPARPGALLTAALRAHAGLAAQYGRHRLPLLRPARRHALGSRAGRLLERRPAARRLPTRLICSDGRGAILSCERRRGGNPRQPRATADRRRAGEPAAAELRVLLCDPSYAANAKKLGEAVRSEDGVATASDAIEAAIARPKRARRSVDEAKVDVGAELVLERPAVVAAEVAGEREEPVRAQLVVQQEVVMVRVVVHGRIAGCLDAVGDAILRNLVNSAIEADPKRARELLRGVVVRQAIEALHGQVGPNRMLERDVFLGCREDVALVVLR